MKPFVASDYVFFGALAFMLVWGLFSHKLRTPQRTFESFLFHVVPTVIAIIVVAMTVPK